MKKKAILKKPRALHTQHRANIDIFRSRPFELPDNQDRTHASIKKININTNMDDEEEKKFL